MDFIANIIKRPLSIGNSPTTGVVPATTAAATTTTTTTSTESRSRSPLIVMDMNRGLDTELNDLFDSAAQDLLHLEQQHSSLLLDDPLSVPTTPTTPTSNHETIQQLLSEINLNLNQVSANELEHLQAMSAELSPLAVKPNNAKPLSIGPAEQQKALNALRQSLPGTPTTINPFHGFEGLESGGNFKFTGLPEFDETQIPELAPLSADMEAQLKAESTGPLSSTVRLDQDYNSDSDVFVECLSLNSEKFSAEPSELEAYRSALNGDFTHQMSQLPDVTLEAIGGDLVEAGIHDDCDEPMDVDDINATMEMLKDVLDVEDHQLLQAQMLGGTLQAPPEQPQQQAEEQEKQQNDKLKQLDETEGVPASSLPQSETTAAREISAALSPPIPTHQRQQVEPSAEAAPLERPLMPTTAVDLELLALKELPLPSDSSLEDDLEEEAVARDRCASPLVLNMTASLSSAGHASAPASPTFPVKMGDASLPAHFPRTPQAPVESAEMPYLEPAFQRPPSADGGVIIAKSPVHIEITVPSPEKQQLNGTISLSAATETDGIFDSQAPAAAPEADKSAAEQDIASGRRTFCVDSVPLAAATEQQRLTFSVINSPDIKQTEPLNDTFNLAAATEQSRRTFCVESVPLAAATEQQRRTFSLQATEEQPVASPAVEATEDFEPMDVDVSLLVETATGPCVLPLSPPIPTHQPNRVIAAELAEAQAVELPPASPPLPTLQRQLQLEQSEQQSPPLPTHQSRISQSESPIPTHQPNRVLTAELAEAQAVELPLSPPLPTLQRQLQSTQPEQQSPPLPTLQRQLQSEQQSPPLPTHQSRISQSESPISTHQPNRVLAAELTEAQAVELPLSPPLPTLQRKLQSEQQSPPLPTHQSQISHSVSPNATVVLEEQMLSAKEQATLSASSEKEDVFVEHFGALSPVSDDIFKAPQHTSNSFASLAAVAKAAASASGGAAEDEFFDADFHGSNNNLILNSSDFDYLYTKGSNDAPVDRSSLLLKFDPLLGTPVPVNNNNITRALSPTIEEHELSANNYSFVIDQSISAKIGRDSEYKPPVDRSKKHAKMSVDVIDNDCNKTFENSNLNSEDKANNYHNMDELEKKIKNQVTKSEDVEKKLKDAEQREEALIKRITEKDKTNSKLNGVIEAYEKAIAELITEKEQLVQNHERQLQEVQHDRDSNYHHLTSLETTFSDLHVKYEKSKEMTSQLKQIEETLLTEKKQTTENLRLQEQRYEKMKSHAMQQLEIANKKLDTITKEHADEVKKLKALLKKEEVSRVSIAEQLQQKSRENADLVKICEELIYGKGQGGSS